MIEGEDEQGAAAVLAVLAGRVHGGGPDVHVDPEMLIATVDARGPGVRVHRFESDAELPDLGQVAGFPALPDPADPADVGLSEGAPVMPDLETVTEKLEGQLGRAGVLGVLDQLEDEVGALAVQLPEQIQYRGVPAVPGDVLVADLPVVGRHAQHPSDPAPPGPGRRPDVSLARGGNSRAWTHLPTGQGTMEGTMSGNQPPARRADDGLRRTAPMPGKEGRTLLRRSGLRDDDPDRGGLLAVPDRLRVGRTGQSPYRAAHLLTCENTYTPGLTPRSGQAWAGAGK